MYEKLLKLRQKWLEVCCLTLSCISGIAEPTVSLLSKFRSVCHQKNELRIAAMASAMHVDIKYILQRRQ